MPNHFWPAGYFIRILAHTLKDPGVILLRKDGYSYGPFIDEMILKHAPRQEMTTAENIGMLKLVYDGLADYFFISQEEAVELVETSGLLTENFKFVRFSDMPGGNQRYLLFSKTTDKTIIDRVDAAIIEQRAADPAGPAKDE
jgi:polar amino acid transport system substrate-binding protein